MTPDPVLSSEAVPAARPPASGLERIVSLSLLAMAIVLLLVWIDQRRRPEAPPPPPFDWQNPMLNAQPGQCVEVSEDTTPGSATWLTVRPTGVVLRPFEAAKSLKGWISPRWPDPKTFPPYLACDERPAPSAALPAGSPQARSELLVFPLNSFGLPLESTVVLRSIEQGEAVWNGKTRPAYMATLAGYLDAPGMWTVFTSTDAPVLGVMRREFFVGEGRSGKYRFRVPETCR